MARKHVLNSLTAILALASAAVLMASPASAQRGGRDHDGGGRGGGHHDNDRGRGGGGDRGGDRGGWNGGGRDRSQADNRGRDNRGGHYDNRRYDRGHSDWSLSLNFGSPYYNYPRPYAYGYGYAAPVVVAPYYNDYGLRPRECRIDYRYDYWSGRPADIRVQICADSYGRVYVVQGSQYFLRWR